MPLPKLLFVSETGIIFCAIDLGISFYLWRLHPKKLSKTVSETRAKWWQFGTVSETWGLGKKVQPMTEIICWWGN